MGYQPFTSLSIIIINKTKPNKVYSACRARNIHGTLANIIVTFNIIVVIKL